eukprot:5362675-Alexandrium_andersonii.AAC.1
MDGRRSRLRSRPCCDLADLRDHIFAPPRFSTIPPICSSLVKARGTTFIPATWPLRSRLGCRRICGPDGGTSCVAGR